MYTCGTAARGEAAVSHPTPPIDAPQQRRSPGNCAQPRGAEAVAAGSWAPRRVGGAAHRREDTKNTQAQRDFIAAGQQVHRGSEWP